jgi:hypothetical protein
LSGARNGRLKTDIGCVFICAKCNIDVPDPELVPAPPRWRRRRGTPSRPMPICPSGHKLRNIVGYTTELSLPPASVRGLGLSCTLLLFGLFEDGLRKPTPWPHMMLAVITGLVLLLGAIAFGYAWTWAGLNGPVHRLTSRACGMAFGCLVPGIVASHALCFHWVNSGAAAFRDEFKFLIALAGINLRQ